MDVLLQLLKTKYVISKTIKALTLIEFEQKSFTKELLLICSIGLNIGFIIGILIYV